MRFEELTSRVIGCALEVHQGLGPGLLESAYEQCLAYELRQSCLAFRLQVPQGVNYKKVTIDCGYRMDVVVEDALVIEIKSVQDLLPIHTAQLLTYMRLSAMPVGLLINFNNLKLKDGIKRLVL